jgi:hypothetical protein
MDGGREKLVGGEVVRRRVNMGLGAGEGTIKLHFGRERLGLWPGFQLNGGDLWLGVERQSMGVRR